MSPLCAFGKNPCPPVFKECARLSWRLGCKHLRSYPRLGSWNVLCYKSGFDQAVSV